MTTDTSDHSNTTDHSDGTPDTADQHTSSVQPLSSDRIIEESISSLTIGENETMCSRTADAQSKETVSENPDSIALASSKCSLQ